MTLPLHEVVSRFDRVRKSGGGFKCLCPAHVDKNPSLSIFRGKSGGTFLNCFAGCKEEDVAAKVGLSIDDYRPRTSPFSLDDRKHVAAIYNYCDFETDSLLFRKIRTVNKRFWIEHPVGIDKFDKGLPKGIKVMPLFNVRSLKRRVDETVYLVEGEKDVDRLDSHGLLSVTNFDGAGKWRPEYSLQLAERNVVILPDNDDKGREHASLVAGELWGVAKTIKVVELPGLAEKEDVSNFLNRWRN